MPIKFSALSNEQQSYIGLQSTNSNTELFWNNLSESEQQYLLKESSDKGTEKENESHSTSSSLNSSSSSSSSTSSSHSNKTSMHDPNATGEAMPVYLNDANPIIQAYLGGGFKFDWQGDEKNKKFSTKERDEFRFFGCKPDDLLSKEASLLGNLILRGEEKDVKEALALVKKNKNLLFTPCIAEDRLKRCIKGRTPLQLAAMVGDVDLTDSITEEKEHGLFEQLIIAAGLSKEEIKEQVSDQLEEVLTSKEAIAENESRNKRVLEAIKTFGEDIILKGKEYIGKNFKELQTLCQPDIQKLGDKLKMISQEAITSGSIFDPKILYEASKWFNDNVNRFEGMWTLQSDLFWVNGFGKLQSQLSSRDAQVVRAGLSHLIDDRTIPARTLNNGDGSASFFDSSSGLGESFYLGIQGGKAQAKVVGHRWSWVADHWKTFVEQKQKRYNTYAKAQAVSTESVCNSETSCIYEY